MSSADYSVLIPERVSLEYGIAGVGSQQRLDRAHLDSAEVLLLLKEKFSLASERIERASGPLRALTVRTER